MPRSQGAKGSKGRIAVTTVRVRQKKELLLLLLLSLQFRFTCGRQFRFRFRFRCRCFGCCCCCLYIISGIWFYMLLIDVCIGSNLFWKRNVCVRIKLRCLESGVLIASGIIVGCAPICILCIQIVTFTDTHKHTHTHMHIHSYTCSTFHSHRYSFVCQSVAATSHPAFPLPLTLSPHSFSSSARMNLIAQMCVKLYFCIRRQSYISEEE